jgi:antitoxin VapB
LLNAQHNFSWLTGGGSNGIDLSRENGAASLLITRSGERHVLASTIEIKRMLAEEVFGDDFDPIDFSWQDEKANSGIVIEKAKFVLETGAKLATDLLNDGTTPSIESKIASCRYELTPEEVERYKQLGKDAGAAARSVIERVAPGESEIEVAAKFRNELAEHNINSVVTLVAADERIDRFRHPVPTDNRWRKTLMIVTCARRGGLIASLSRLISVGEVSGELRHKTEAAAFVNAKLLAATRPGAVGSELYRVASDAYAENGFPNEINLHHQGGAIGYRTREWVAHPKSEEVVKMNQAFAWNPSITGTKVEETVIVTKSGVETITTSPDFPVITTSVDGHEYQSPGILNI